MSTLVADSLKANYGRRTIFENLSIIVPTGKISVLVGPNGSGKSTLLKTLTRALKPAAGTVTIQGKSIFDYDSKAFARKVGMLGQHLAALEGLTVEELVSFGRHPHQSFWKKDPENDGAILEQALEAVGLQDMRTMKISALSGGQRQRAWLAMTLAQETEVIVLDEPTSYLDIKHQIATMDLIQNLNKQRRKTILMVLHDLNLAARVADHIAVLSQGRVYQEGTPWEVLTAEVLQNVYEVKAWVVKHPELGVPQFFL